jgi:TPR repeat protein
MTPPGERKQPPPPVRTYNNEPATTPAALAAAGNDEGDTTPVIVDEVPVVAPVTVSELESLRHSAKLAPTDTMLQVKYAKRLAEAAIVLPGKYSDATTPAGASAVVDTKTERKNRDTWNTQALKILKKVINQHVSNTNRAAITEAMFFLASNYGSGGKLGLEPDYQKAYDLYVRAARLDHAESCYRAAVCSEIGAGTHRDFLRSFQWYKRAAQLDDVSAMYKLGMIALNGLLGQPRDFMDGFAWLKRAADRADHANPHAVHELGLLYERGQTPGNNDDSGANGSNNNSNNSNGGAAIALSAVIVKDEAHAFDLFLRAAQLGYPPAQYRLGAAYEYGTLGRAVDPKRSIAWYSHAAERGEPESELALSGWYLTGSNGVLHQSDTEAYLWARRAAEKGLAKAEYALGYFVEVGIGVKRDPEEAKRWYFKAAAQKHPKALARLQELRSSKAKH